MTTCASNWDWALKREALGVVSTQSGRPIHLLEKDVWVVWALKELYQSPFAEHLTFKGGTSLSKAYNAIQRFSEDIDVTYDIRVIAGDLVSQQISGFPFGDQLQPSGYGCRVVYLRSLGIFFAKEHRLVRGDRLGEVTVS